MVPTRSRSTHLALHSCIVHYRPVHKRIHRQARQIRVLVVISPGIVVLASVLALLVVILLVDALGPPGGNWATATARRAGNCVALTGGHKGPCRASMRMLLLLLLSPRLMLQRGRPRIQVVLCSLCGLRRVY